MTAAGVSREIEFRGPQASADGIGWCALCSMLYKNAVMQTEEGRAAIADVDGGNPGDNPIVNMVQLAARDGIPAPREAEVWAPARLLGGAVVPTCWPHLTGLSMSAILPANQLPAGSVPLLGGRRG